MEMILQQHLKKMLFAQAFGASFFLDLSQSEKTFWD